MFRLIFISIFISSTLLLSVQCAFSKEESYCPGKEEWCPVSAGPITAWTAPLCGKGKLVVQPYFFYYRARGVFDDKGSYKAYKDGEAQQQYLGQLLLYYGITDKFEIDFQADYLENHKKTDRQSARSNGFTDSILFSRYCLIEERGWMPHITAIAQMKFPTGKYQKGGPDKLGTDIMGSGSYDPGYGAVLTKKLRPFIFHADCIYNIPIETKVDGIRTRYANYINYDFAVECFLPKGFNLLFETNFFMQGDTRQSGELIPSSDSRYLLLAPGIGWSCDKIQTLVVYQRTIAGSNVDVNDSVVFTLVCAF